MKRSAMMALSVFNNRKFTSDEFYRYFAANDNKYTRKQCTDTLNRIKYVKKYGNGVYAVKGRNA